MEYKKSMEEWVDSNYQSSGMNLNRPAQARSILGTPKVQHAAKVSYQRVSEAQMQDRRKNGALLFM